MAEPKTRPTDVPVADFIAAVDNPRRRADAEVMQALLSKMTGVAPVMWGPSIIGYGSYKGPTGDWPRVGEIDEERTRLLVALPLSDEPALRAVVEDALCVTQALLAQAADARQSVMNELRGLHRGQRGASAYQQRP